MIARKRVFRAGHAGSTFPWEVTAAALYQHAGRCWLASEIAIIGAASPLREGYSRRPEAAAFGPNGHPSELLAQTRSHAGDTTWWRTQLQVAADDLGRAEWSFALWSVASSDVLSELLPVLDDVIDKLTPQRQQTVLRAVATITNSGWLQKRPVTSRHADGPLTAFIKCRNGQTRPTTSASKTPDSAEPRTPLLDVARSEGWFKVDTQPAYR